MTSQPLQARCEVDRWCGRRAPQRPPCPSAGAARTLTPGRAGSPRRAFTLVELLLTLAMLALLAGVVVVNLAGVRRSRTFDEGLDRFATTLRLLRAEAAARGQRYRLRVDPETELLVVEREPEPLEAPGEFAAAPEGVWQAYLPGDSLRVVRCELTGSSAYRLGTASGSQASRDDEPPGEVMFYPDGSCDFARFVLLARDVADPRGAVVELNGLTGKVLTRVQSAEEIGLP